MMEHSINYRKIIESNFLIDAADSGQLVPFKFNEVQEKYYQDLCRDYDIENMGLIGVPVRENILKARREGFSSLILALFAADDIMQENPTETDVLSYKDDATNTFKKRYRTYVLSFFAKEMGIPYEQIRDNINVLEEVAPLVLSVDAEDIELKHNKAHFQCNTASARVGGRGGVRHKILFSEIAFYPDTSKMLASEMIEATMRQVDIKSGCVFAESTENGVGTYQHKMWEESKKGRSRFKNRFYGAGMFYSPEQIAVIKSEYIDMDSFRRDYPVTEDDLFKGSAKSFVTEMELEKLRDPKFADKELIYMAEFQGQNGIDVVEMIEDEINRLVYDNPGYALYAGLDEAKSIDATVLFVLKAKNRSLGKGGLAGIEIDVTRGDFIADWFERNTNFFIKKVKFSRPSKSIMYTNLQVVIGDQLTSLPPWKDQNNEWVSDEAKHFFNQMMSLEKEIIGNMLVVHHPKGNCNSSDHNYDDCLMHDDYPDAWMMAEDMYVEINGVPKRKSKPVIPTVPNVVQNLLDTGGFRDKFRGNSSGIMDYE